jgi:hypothetical protein
MNFEFHNPTRLIFGAGTLSQLGEVASKHGKKALIVTGGGSVKRSGIFGRAVAGLKAAGIAFAEYDGVEPNPKITSVRRGSQIARDEGCDVIIALGGGSTMDASKVIADGKDLEARAQLQWASILALNGWVSAGTNGGYPVHMIEHTLSAYHDITHAAGLSAINPSWMRFVAQSHPAQFVQFAQRIFGLDAKGPDDRDCALQGVDRFKDFLKNIDCPTSLSELNIDDSLITRYAQDTLRIRNVVGKSYDGDFSDRYSGQYLMPPFRMAFFPVSASRFLMRKKSFKKEYQIVRPSDGEVKWIFGRGELEFDDIGHCMRMIGTVQDITERKKAEASRRFTQFAVDNTIDQAFWTTADGHFVYVNEAACRTLG